MKSNPKLASLQKTVKAAQEEFDMAVACREAWAPTVYDSDLHRRMGTSYATNTFHVIRVALRREMLLALLRLWDKDSRAIRMDVLAKILGDRQIISTLATDRASQISMPDVRKEIEATLNDKTESALKIIKEYSQNGSKATVLEKLRTLRHGYLAHRQIEPAAASKINANELEIETFYQDMLKLISLLLHVVEGNAYDPEGTASVFRHHAELFWASARGERTEGHPNFRASQQTLPPA